MHTRSHTHASPLGPRTRRPGSRAFTLIELLIGVLVIGVLMSLLIYGMVYARRYVASVADARAVDALASGVNDFKREFGFFPPLVRERAPMTPAAIETGGGVNRVAVYQETSTQHKQWLRREGQPVPPATNPFEDYRYSERTLPYYLVGALAEPVAAGNSLPIDGISGPGFYPPDEEGSFVIPRDVIAAGAGNAAQRNRTGKTYEPLVNLGSGSLTLFADPGSRQIVEIRGRKNATIRYYRWLPGRLVNGSYIVEELRDLNMPLLVGRLVNDPARTPSFISTPEDRDLEKNTSLRSATWAIVAAGPDGVFGDEPIATIRTTLGLTTAIDELTARLQAEKDNIVRVGN
ncbi:MAG: type II secretion system protein [Phycisphaerales bacterium]|nr:type II secretion system protein [Phycisphaerales bacterium]